MARKQSITDYSTLNEQERQECLNWEICKNSKSNCVFAYEISEGEPKRCAILSDTDFIRPNGKRYDCPFYK